MTCMCKFSENKKSYKEYGWTFGQEKIDMHPDYSSQGHKTVIQ